MKYIYIIAVMLGCISTAISQPKIEYGQKFAFDSKIEERPNFVLLDNYNTFLLTVIDVYGLTPGHQMVVRKFDQKHNLVETFKFDFPKIDPGAFYKYLGFAEIKNTKVATFVQVYSGKVKKSEIYSVEFDKTTGKFTSTLLASNPIESQSKSGSAILRKSDNGKFIAINYTHHRPKDLPEKNLMMVLDASTLAVTWQKELSFEDEYTSQNLDVTNTGKVVLVRDMKGSRKGITYLTILSAGSQEEKRFETPIFFNVIKAVSIGTQDYLVALNSKSKNFITEFYNNLLLLDLKTGAILTNNKLTDFASIPNLEYVSIRHIGIQNNEMHVFTEALAEIKTTPGTPESLKTKYRIGPSIMYVTSLDGKVKSKKELAIDPTMQAGLSQSFGLTNIKGVYFINSGNYGGIYSLSNAKNFEIDGDAIMLTDGDPYADIESRFINQLFSYSPDKNALLLGRILGNGEMALVSAVGVK